MSRRRLNRVLAMTAALVATVALVPLAASADDDKRVVIAERNNIVAFDPATGVGTQEGLGGPSFHTWKKWPE